ncbi:hypothetical protein HNQ91_001776 [Filimonas zeae]|uniref:Uncharacterized protein n=1 Tax=Filimonas zeae TaxID=1737353 RepID=A0A917J0C4_9BACT|nr:hypothetical protein [Filimonas zeae]MDR6338725.1 hypothetical protein [Filimonas zeae]GGH66886.1 hypothetical protein GCM10011379_21530 [Filimonas zeae]
MWDFFIEYFASIITFTLGAVTAIKEWKRDRLSSKKYLFFIIAMLVIAMIVDVSKKMSDSLKEDKVKNDTDSLKNGIAVLKSKLIEKNTSDSLFQIELNKKFRIIRDSITNEPKVINQTNSYNTDIGKAGVVNIGR